VYKQRNALTMRNKKPSMKGMQVQHKGKMNVRAYKVKVHCRKRKQEATIATDEFQSQLGENNKTSSSNLEVVLNI